MIPTQIQEEVLKELPLEAQPRFGSIETYVVEQRIDFGCEGD
jgi:hypothetical protein